MLGEEWMEVEGGRVGGKKGRRVGFGGEGKWGEEGMEMGVKGKVRRDEMVVLRLGGLEGRGGVGRGEVVVVD